MKKIWMIAALLGALPFFIGQAQAEDRDNDRKQAQVEKQEQDDKGDRNLRHERGEKEKKWKKEKRKDKRDKDKDRDRDRDKDRGERDGDRIYGSQLMTEKERMEHRDRMRSARTDAERDQIRREHHDRIVERAKQRGVTLPDEPPVKRGQGR